jgi:hypothetical protein
LECDKAGVGVLRTLADRMSALHRNARLSQGPRFAANLTVP